jgi:hypothetical protein
MIAGWQAIKGDAEPTTMIGGPRRDQGKGKGTG